MRLKLYRGQWAAVWTENGRTKRRSLRTADRRLAEQLLADAQRRPIGDSVEEIMTAYLADLDQRAARPDRAHDAWKALKGTFGALRPDQITRDLCRFYTKRRRQDGRAPGTIRKELETLRAALRWKDPQHKAVLEMPAGTPPRDRYLTRDEFNRLYAAAKTEHVRLFILLALSTAGRKEALLSLTWDRVDFDRGLVRLGDGGERRKGRATVPMTPALRTALLAARKAALSDYVIEYAGKRVGDIKKGFANAAAAAGIEDVSPHVLRHTAAVWMAEAGHSMSEIAQFLGHGDSRITERTYARYSPDHLRLAASALDVQTALLGSPEPSGANVHALPRRKRR